MEKDIYSMNIVASCVLLHNDDISNF